MLGLLFVSDGVSVRLHNINMTSKGFLCYDMFMDYEESVFMLVYLPPTPQTDSPKNKDFLNIGFP